MEMAGPKRLKLGGLVEGMREIVLAKEFFGSVIYFEIADFRFMELVFGKKIPSVKWLTSYIY